MRVIMNIFFKSIVESMMAILKLYKNKAHSVKPFLNVCCMRSGFIYTLLFFLIFACDKSIAGYIYKAPGAVDASNVVRCPGNDGNGFTVNTSSYFKAFSCNVPIRGYVASSGYYHVDLVLGTSDTQIPGIIHSGSFYVDATKPLEQQNITIDSGADSSFSAGVPLVVGLCYYLTSHSGEKYSLYYSPIYSDRCESAKPIPPTPVPPSVSCKINNGNSLSVNLGTLVRTDIPTTPGAGNSHSVEIPVTCTGGSVTMKMQLNYTPVTISGSQVVKSSVNGIGVAVNYNNNFLSPTDISTIQYGVGTSNLVLAFEAVRDSLVDISDITTGPFSASAVLMMTQQ